MKKYIFILSVIAGMAVAAVPLYQPELPPLAGKGISISKAPDGSPALIFDGTANATLPNIPAALKGDEISLSMWGMLSEQTKSEIALGFIAMPPYYTTEPLQFKLNTEATDFGVHTIACLTSEPVIFGEWHHMAFFYSLSKGEYGVYVDGVRQTGGKISNDMPSPVDLKHLFAPLGSNGFKGGIASVKVYSELVPLDELLSFTPSAEAVSALSGEYSSLASSVPKSHSALADEISAVVGRIKAFSAQNVSLSVKEWRRLKRETIALKKMISILPPEDHSDFIPYTCDPYSAEKHLPDSVSSDAASLDTISITVAKGEFEGATFLLHPLKNVDSLKIEAAPLAHGSQTLPSDALDIRVVKCWFTTAFGWNSYFAGGREFPMLTPELLVYDDSLVISDIDKRRNYLRVGKGEGSYYYDISKPGTPSDSKSFNYVSMPVADGKGPFPESVKLEQYQNKQFWITVKAPKDAAPGLYKTSISITADGGDTYSLPVEVNILPYELPRPMTRYDLSKEYIIGMMNHCQLASHIELGNSLELAEKRHLAEMKNMAEHNVSSPLISDFDNVNKIKDATTERQLQLMREAGIPLELVFCGGPAFTTELVSAAPIANPIERGTPEYYAALDRYRKKLEYIAKRFDDVVGHRNAYFYGLDESGPATVRKEFATFAILNEFGFRSFVTSGVSQWANFVVDSNDRPAGINFTDARRWHDGGSRVFSYAAPFTGPENPEVWRRNKGLRMYFANYDGIVEYVWYEGFNIWNEFIQSSRYKNFNIVYPTMDGVLDTVAWEAFREAVDDVRYMTLLRQYCLTAMKSTDADLVTLGKKHALWLENSDPESVDFAPFRNEVIARIDEFRKLGIEPAQTYIPVKRKPLGTTGTKSLKEIVCKPINSLTTFDALMAEGDRLNKASLCDLAIPYFQKAAALPGLDVKTKLEAEYKIALVYLKLLNFDKAKEQYQAVINNPNASGDVKAKSYIGLIKLAVEPMENEYVTTKEALDAAKAIYKAGLDDKRIPYLTKPAILAALAPALLEAGETKELTTLLDSFLKATTKLRPADHNLLTQFKADACFRDKEYNKALPIYEELLVKEPKSPVLLEKVGDCARYAKKFRRAQQAFSDLIPMIDEVEDSTKYKRIKGIIVALTKATQRSAKEDATSLMDVENFELNELSLD